MSEGVLRNAEGEPIYYWDTVENGIRFQFEYYQRFKGEGDFESIFTIPHSEYYKIYAKYKIDPSVPIEVAITQISDSGRGAKFKQDLLTKFQWVDSFSWLSFPDTPEEVTPEKGTPPQVEDAPRNESNFRSY